ncbi:C2 domain protein [Melia azedarach]|uniref:C2 domain protein n=1 Tax=Melia azedarach TaxID=155640 RepID=A0ACC1XX36_MELAZ|nr:C2 domain protein [Melia azedarach]
MVVACPHQFFSSLSCELRIIKAKNIEFKSSSGGNLFVRYYLSAGDNKRIQLNSKEISSNSDLIWNEAFALECLGTEDAIKELKQQSVVLELRWRKTKANFLGKKSKSELLGRAEIPWKTVFESPNMEVEKWVSMVSKNRSRVLEEDLKPPSLQVAMKVEGPKMVEILEKNRKNERTLKKWDECGCANSGACSCSDYEIFALVAAMEAL